MLLTYSRPRNMTAAEAQAAADPTYVTTANIPTDFPTGINGVPAIYERVSDDFGATWQKADLGKPKNKYDWQRWTATVKLPSDGYFEIWTRATDSKGVMQPHQAGLWNPQGYGGNAMHRIAVLVG